MKKSEEEKTTLALKKWRLEVLELCEIFFVTCWWWFVAAAKRIAKWKISKPISLLIFTKKSLHFICSLLIFSRFTSSQDAAMAAFQIDVSLNVTHFHHHLGIGRGKIRHFGWRCVKFVMWMRFQKRFNLSIREIFAQFSLRRRCPPPAFIFDNYISRVSRLIFFQLRSWASHLHQEICFGPGIKVIISAGSALGAS